MKKLLAKRINFSLWKVCNQNDYRHLPSRFVIGAQKSGTTALFHYFSQHPQILPTKIKELNFFHSEIEYSKGINYYQNFFAPITFFNRRKVVIDISPGYLAHAERSARRIHAFNSDAKLVAIFRNPVDRAYSCWNMYRKFYQVDSAWYFKHRESLHGANFDRDTVRRPDFGKCFYSDLLYEFSMRNKGLAIEMPILHHGLYAEQLEHYYKVFNADQILVLLNEDLSTNTKLTLAKIENHWGLDETNWDRLDIKPFFEGGYVSKPDEKSIELLREFYRPFNSMFESISGVKVSW